MLLDPFSFLTIGGVVGGKRRARRERRHSLDVAWGCNSVEAGEKLREEEGEEQSLNKGGGGFSALEKEVKNTGKKRGGDSIRSIFAIIVEKRGYRGRATREGRALRQSRGFPSTILTMEKKRGGVVGTERCLLGGCQIMPESKTVKGGSSGRKRTLSSELKKSPLEELGTPARSGL